jgi:hypothetical protein
MYSAKGHPASPGWGCPIRTSPDHSLLAAPRGLSQPSTSFIGSWCQGIHRAPLLARRLDLSNSPSRQDQRSQKNLACSAVAEPGSGPHDRPVSVCSTTLRFFRYTPSALASASRGTSTRQTSRSIGRGATTGSAIRSCSFPSCSLCSKAQKWPDTVEPLRHTRKLSSEPYAVGVSNCLMVRFSWSGMRAHATQRPVRPAKDHYISPRLNRASRACLTPIGAVEPRGLEPLTSALQRRRSPS